MTLVMMRTTIRLYEVDTDSEGKIPHNVVREQCDTPGVGLECMLAPRVMTLMVTSLVLEEDFWHLNCRANVLMSCVAFLFWHIVADVLIFCKSVIIQFWYFASWYLQNNKLLVKKKTWMAFLVADGVALLFVRGGALFLLLQRWDCQTIHGKEGCQQSWYQCSPERLYSALWAPACTLAGGLSCTPGNLFLLLL